MSAKVHELPLGRAAIASFVAMCITDIIGTAMVIFESNYNLVASGMCDVLGYIASLICSVLALDSILRDGWRTRRSLTLIGVITIANFLGTAVGVIMVEHLTGHS